MLAFAKIATVTQAALLTFLGGWSAISGTLKNNFISSSYLFLIISDMHATDFTKYASLKVSSIKYL